MQCCSLLRANLSFNAGAMVTYKQAVNNAKIAAKWVTKTLFDQTCTASAGSLSCYGTYVETDPR